MAGEGEEILLDLQMKLFQASEDKLKAIAEDLKVEINGKKKSSVVNMICLRIEDNTNEKDGDEKVEYIKELASRYFKSVKESSKQQGEPADYKDGDKSLQAILKSTSVFRRQFKMVGQIGNPDQKDKLSFTSLTRQIESGLAQGYKEIEIVDGVAPLVQEWCFAATWKHTKIYLSTD